MTKKFGYFWAPALLLTAPVFGETIINVDASQGVAPGLHCAIHRSTTNAIDSRFCSDSNLVPRADMTVGGLSGPDLLAFYDAGVDTAQQSSEWRDTVTFHHRSTGTSGMLDLTYAYQGGTSFSVAVDGASAATTLSGNGTLAYAFPFTFGVATPLSYTYEDNLAQDGHLFLQSFKVFDQNGELVRSSPTSAAGVTYAPEPGTSEMLLLGAAGLLVLWRSRRPLR